MFYKILIGIKRIIKGYGYIVSKRLKLYGMSNREKFMFVKNNRINIIDGGGGILFLATSFKLYNRCPFWKNIIKIQGNTSVHNAYILFSDGDNLLSIGENVAMGNNIGFVIQESTSLIVGNHCQIAKDVFIRTSDSHSIVDEDGRRVNFAESIKIGNNVWIGQNSIILKGCDIPNNVVIGCASVCTKKEYDGNAVYAGVPARKIKSGVTWRAERL